jgi:predicted XRE-type DNA-binding protein
MKLHARFESGQSATEQDTPTTVAWVSPAAKNLAMAHRLARLIDQGLIADYTAAARLLGVSQPRLTHLMSLVLLAPQIQEAILAGKVAPTDKTLRRLARIASWAEQLAAFAS